MLYHNSHDETYRFPIGALKCGDSLTLRFRSDEGEPLLRTWDGEESVYPMESIGGCFYETTINVPTQPMLFWYDFIIATPNGVMHYGTSADQLGGEGLCSYDQPASYQVTVYDPDYTTPTFLR